MTITNEGLSNLDIKYHFLIDNILDVVGELDLNGIFTYVNPYIYDELGYQPNEIIGREIYEFVHPDDAKKITKVLLRRPKSHDFIPEIRLKNDKNQFIWYEIKARRIKDYNNQRKILITLKNISKVKLLEEKLEKKEENYQKITNSIPEIKFWKILTPSKYERAIRTTSEMLKVIIENIPQCVFWKDINFKYLGCNGNYSEFIGIEQPESIIGKTDEDLLFNREKIQQIRESETSVMLSGKPLYHTNESWIIEKGKDIWLDINKVPLIDAKGDVNGILVAFEEITDRKIAEEKLRNSEKKYKNLSIELETIMDIIPSMIFVKNLSGIYTRVNQIFADYLKLEKEDIIGKSTFDLFPQEVATNLTRDDLEVIKNGIPKLNIEETVEFPVGKVTENISKMPFYNEKDEINGVIGFAIDITERKELEQRLIKSEERYRELANSLPQVICEADERGNLTFVNNNAYSVFGYTPDDFNKGLNALQMLIPEDRKRAMENIKRVLRGKKEEKIEDNEYTALRKDGSTFPVIIYSSPIIYKNTSVGTRSIIIDITEKIKAKQRLKESEEKYRSIFEQGPDSIFLVDPETGEIFSFNERTYLNLGYSREEFSSLKISDFEIIDSPEEINKRIKKIINKGSDMFETKHITKEGEVKDILVSTNTIIIDGKKFIQSICRDITERKKAEIKLIESEEKYKYRYEFESLVSQLSLDFVNCSYEELDELINKALKQIAKFAKAVRTSLFICSDDLTRITNTNEWCANPKDSQINMLQDIPFETFGYYMKLLKEKRDIIISSLDDIPADAKGEREWIKKHGFRSLLFVPIINNNKLYGTLGFYGEINVELEWSLDFINLLKIFANAFANTILRKQSEEKLKESEEKYKSLFEQFPMAIFLINVEGVIEDCNTSTVDLFGYDKEELLGKKFLKFDIFPPDTKSILAQSFSKFLKTRVPEHSEIQMYRKDGESIWINSYPIVIKIAGSSYILATLQDITQCKTSEEEIRYQAKIIDNMSEGLYLIKLEDGTIVFTNPAFEDMFGYDPGEMIGKNVSIVNAPTDKTPEETRNDIIETLKDTGEWHGEVLNAKKDGTPFWCYANVSVFDHPDHGSVIISIHTDITERKSKEEEARLHSEIMTNMSEGVYLVRWEDFNIVYVNPRFEEMFGYDPGEMIGQNVVIVNAPTDKTPEETKVEIVGFVRDTGEWHGDVLNIKKDGTPFWCYANVSLFDHPEYGRVLIAVHTDITEHKEIKEEWEKFFNLSLHILLIAGFDGIILRINPGWKEILGYDETNLLGHNFMDLVHPDDREATKLEMEKLSKGSVTNYFENRYKSKDGTYRTLAWSAVPNLEKKVVYTIAYDVTKQRHAEREIVESEKKLKDLIEAVPIGITISNPKGELFEVNSHALKIFGYDSREEFLETPAKSLYVNPAERDQYIQLLESGPVREFEVKFKRKDGTLFWGSLTSIAKTVGDDVMFFNTVQDITDRKISDQKLRESEERYRILIETAVMGLVEFDVIGNTVSYINPKLIEILGYTKEELNDAKAFMGIVHPEDAKDLIRSSEDKFVEFRIFTKEGKLKWLSGTRNNQYNQEGDSISMRLWLQDSTVSKEVEEIKSSLLTRFSHEFKTPLISIKGFADFLLTEYKVDLDEKILSFLRRIKDGSNRLQTLINSFIESSQLEKAVVQVNLKLENVSYLIQEVLYELEGFTEMREHTLDISLDEKLIAAIDREKIYTVISNILINAIDYTPQGGKISIKSSTDKNFLTISVKDNGLGLTEEEKNRLFKPFGKIERYGKGWDIAVGGMGMGLYISKEIIELHGGKIGVESEGRNKGSTFYFSIPITK